MTKKTVLTLSQVECYYIQNGDILCSINVNIFTSDFLFLFYFRQKEIIPMVLYQSINLLSDFSHFFTFFYLMV